jgi:hypothetical protein
MSQEPVTRNEEPETSHQEPETIHYPGIRNRKPAIMSQEPIARNEVSETSSHEQGTRNEERRPAGRSDYQEPEGLKGTMKPEAQIIVLMRE